MNHCRGRSSGKMRRSRIQERGQTLQNHRNSCCWQHQTKRKNLQ